MTDALEKTISQMSKVKCQRSSLYLIPTTLGKDSDLSLSFPSGLEKIVNSLDGLIAESAKTAFYFLSKFKLSKKTNDYQLLLLNEHTRPREFKNLANLVSKGQNWGLISDAGCPTIADPGFKLVKFAHQNNIKVVPMVGPSSILLALMASGLTGQCFAFHGYLPKEQPARIAQIKRIEAASGFRKETQIFIETPYRNDHLFEDLLNTCRPFTDLCVAVDLTFPTEQIITKKIEDWQKSPKPELNKRPAVFLLSSYVNEKKREDGKKPFAGGEKKFLPFWKRKKNKHDKG